MKALQLFFVALAATGMVAGAGAQGPDTPVPVRVEQVREQPVQRDLPLSGRIFSRHDADLSLTMAGELAWVLEPGVQVKKGQLIAQLDQQPILLRKQELEHHAQRERVNTDYLEKELTRLRRLKEDNNASERLVDEGESRRDISRLEVRSLQARIEQVDDELRRSQVVAPFDGVIAERDKQGGEYARPGDVIVRLVDLAALELRFQMPVVYLSRISVGETVSFTAQGGQLLGESPVHYEATVRTVIPAADINSQTFEVRADLLSPANENMIAGQLANVAVQIAANRSSLQIPRDAIVLRAEGGYVFRINGDNTAHKVMVEVGEGSREWVSVTGDLNAGDWVAVRGVERLQDGQTVSRQGS